MLQEGKKVEIFSTLRQTIGATTNENEGQY